MKFTVILLLLGIIVSVYGDCVSKNKTYKEGESWIEEGVCMKFECDPQGSISGLGCALYNVRDKSKYNYIKEDNSKPYPACCPHYEEK